MEGAVEDKLNGEASMVKGVGTLNKVDGSIPEKVPDDVNSLAPEPDGPGKEESHARRIAEQVELVQLPGLRAIPQLLRSGGFVEQLLGKDILGDKDDGSEQGVYNS